MKPLFNTLFLAIIMLMSSCGSGSSDKKTEYTGYFGKLVSIQQDYQKEDSIIKAKAKTESESVDDLVAAKSKIEKNEEKAKAEFNAEAASMSLPITIPFIDSTGNAMYTVKDVKITAFEWGRAILEATLILKVNSEKTMGGQIVPYTVPALMLNNNNQVLKDHDSDNWFILSALKEMKAGETQKVTGSILIKAENADMAKILFKSYDAYKRAKGWN